MVVILVTYVYRQELSYSRRVPGYFTPIGVEAPPVARDGSEFARTLSQRCYPHTAKNGVQLVFSL